MVLNQVSSSENKALPVFLRPSSHLEAGSCWRSPVICLWLSSDLCKPRLSRTTDALGWEALSCSCHPGIMIMLLRPNHLSSSPCLLACISIMAPVSPSIWSFYRSEHPEDTVKFHSAEYITVFPPLICCCVLSATMITTASPGPESVPKPQRWLCYNQEISSHFSAVLILLWITIS